MKKNIHYITAAFVLAAALVVGCKPTVTPAQDKTPPAEVTKLTAKAGDGKVSLEWTNPADTDLYQVEITASPAAGTLANPVYLAAEKSKAMNFTAEGLSNGTAYTFTVKTIDKSLNKSKGVTTEKPITPTGTGDKTPPQGGGGGTGGSAADTTAPAEVTELQPEAFAGAIRLTWKDPADADLWGIEITSNQEIVGRAAAPIPENAILVAKGQQSRKISNLMVGQSYTFTVKTIDNSGNKSAGIQTPAVSPEAGEPMTITLTQSPAKETKTNGDVTVTVKSSTSIKEAKWVKGAASAKTIFESGTLITGNSFPVSENGIYSVAVLDNDGRREVETITIENIDKTPPAKVTGLAANYSATAQKIMVNWQNPPDSDFAGLTLSWKKEGGETTNVPLETSNTSYEIPNITADDSTYTIAVTAKDDVGNTSTSEEKTVKATATAEITEVMLNRTHLDTLMSNRNIVVTITGSNFDKLTSLLVQVTDGSTSQPPVPATIDTTNNTATATVQAPTPASPTDEGTEYIVKVFINGTTESDKTATFKVSKPAEVKTITLSKNSIEFGTETKVTVSVTGTNFDIRGVTKIKLLDSKGAEVTASIKIVPAGEGTATNFTAELPLPSESGVYTVAVYFDEVKESKTSTLQLYRAPEITSVSIPKAGTGYAGNKLPVTITGKNFTAPGASFSGSGASITNFNVVNDTFATAEVTCPYSAGEHTVTVTCGSASTTGTFAVKDYSAYTVGKIVLADKTLKSKDEYTTIDPSNPPVAIICGSNSYKAPQMIALHTGSDLVWVKVGSTGYNTKFEGIICTPSQTGSGAAQTATFTGDTDGSDNWEYIKSIDSAGAADAATNYLAFYWVNTYNETYKTQLNNKTFAWYMPSLAELCGVYRNREAINESLAKIHGLDSNYADSTLGTSVYWSSSQDSNYRYYAWLVDFSGGYVGDDSKDGNFRVCCLSGF